MFHAEPCDGKGVRMRWKIATHCSTKRSWVEQCVAIFHRMRTSCHCTVLSETFVLYNTSNVYKFDCKVSKFDLIRTKKAKSDPIAVHFCYTLFVLWRHRHATSTLTVARRATVQNFSTLRLARSTNQIARILVGVVQYVQSPNCQITCSIFTNGMTWFYQSDNYVKATAHY